MGDLARDVCTADLDVQAMGLLTSLEEARALEARLEARLNLQRNRPHRRTSSDDLDRAEMRLLRQLDRAHAVEEALLEQLAVLRQRRGELVRQRTDANSETPEMFLG